MIESPTESKILPAYELLMPDGSGSGVWACGNCHEVHMAGNSGSQKHGEWNREKAERCCVCNYCGGFLDRTKEVVGVGHAKCSDDAYALSRQETAAKKAASTHVPIGEPIPPETENPWPCLLYRKMSDISEEHWCAGWTIGNEFSLWDILQARGGEYGALAVEAGDIETLRVFSEKAGGWIVWDDEEGPRFMLMADWLAYRDAANSKGEGA